MILEEFSNIESDDAARSFVLKALKSPAQASNVLGEWTGAVERKTAYLKHRWHNPSGPVQNEPDVHVLRIASEYANRPSAQ